ncbi:M3 family oligoendopeptidase [Bdellovibrio sp. HCB2-146]|uniref:M3 family oligoendopeptidase n=1 Tax=Bdellovibrio sp. HCB2-146 TaxID=3394362 RepID=UPI0039BD7A49
MENAAWNLESEYPSIHSDLFKQDWDFVTNDITEMTKEMESLRNEWGNPSPQALTKIKDILKSRKKFDMLLGNLSSYLYFASDIDLSNVEITKKRAEAHTLWSRHSQIMMPLYLFIKKCDEAIIQEFLKDPELENFDFLWQEKRQQNIYSLSEKEEVLIEALATDGFHAWSNLYRNLSGQMKAHLQYPDRTETLGMAQASALTRSPDALHRKVAWQAIQEAWTEHKVTAAAILNSLAGQRLEINKKRSHTKERHFLTEAMLANRMTPETLDALIGACRSSVEKTRMAPKMMARLLKKDVIDPWDLLAPGPEKEDKSTCSFEEGVRLIAQAYGEVSPEMGDFVEMMYQKRWIEGRVLPNKAPGAYCGGFRKSKEPRVFMTYMGSNSDISTLAHELGHAYHSWVMRDMPEEKTHFTMGLAETASIFGETVLRDTLIQKASTKEQKADVAWNEIQGAATFLLNIPARFDFEKEFYERRQSGILMADEMMDLTDQVWSRWYGRAITQNDKMFWATKLHFSMSRTSFYNFPYTFGYLFSLSIYARRNELGAEFMKTYVNILRDTGSMTPEALVQKHLGEDIREQKFWQKAIDHVVGQLKSFESLM